MQNFSPNYQIIAILCYYTASSWRERSRGDSRTALERLRDRLSELNAPVRQVPLDERTNQSWRMKGTGFPISDSNHAHSTWITLMLTHPVEFSIISQTTKLFGLIVKSRGEPLFREIIEDSSEADGFPLRKLLDEN